MQDKKSTAFMRLLEIMDRLRAECPWDREQTFESLRNNTIEETFELVEAIEEGNLEEICKELGDLLLHVVFYAKIGEEQKAFDIADVANRICDKLIYRHPHVFGAIQADNAATVVRNWEDLKLKERKQLKGVLAGVPKSLPAMVKAYRIGAKAAAAGFDWEKPSDVWSKVREEIIEVEAEINATDNTDNAEARTRLQDEFGDLFFAMINAARLYNVDPELALERCNKKFIRRFEYMENHSSDTGKTIRELSLVQMDELWNRAKAEENNKA